MTNKEIIRKFEFELELGLFNQAKNLKPHQIYSFKIHNMREYEIFYDILKNLKYKQSTHNKKVMIDFKLKLVKYVIVIDIKTKEFWCCMIYPLEATKYKANNLPEYIYDYKINKFQPILKNLLERIPYNERIL